jgi:hypothetical protein
LSNEQSESESESESDASGMSVDKWNVVKMGDNEPKEYTFSQNRGPEFNLLPYAEPVDYFHLFFSEGLLNNITKTNSQDSWSFWTLSIIWYSKERSISEIGSGSILR